MTKPDIWPPLRSQSRPGGRRIAAGLGPSRSIETPAAALRFGHAIGFARLSWLLGDVFDVTIRDTLEPRYLIIIAA